MATYHVRLIADCNSIVWWLLAEPEKVSIEKVQWCFTRRLKGLKLTTPCPTWCLHFSSIFCCKIVFLALYRLIWRFICVQSYNSTPVCTVKTYKLLCLDQRLYASTFSAQRVINAWNSMPLSKYFLSFVSTKRSRCRLCVDHFSGPGRAIGRCVCVSEQLLLNQMTFDLDI